jgi:glyoxylase-like metal-dependent hydrolase (beta-lactamase superfamily II)
VPGVHQIPLGIVNAYLLEQDGFTLIDTVVSGSDEQIPEAVGSLGGEPGDVRHILVTHCHETGKRSLAKLAALDFDVACFGHGNPIVEGAADRFRKKWGKG